MLLFAPRAAAAQPAPDADADASGAASGVHRGPTDRAELEAFLDGLMAAQMAAHDVAGAAVAVVRGDSVLLLKGWGWADVDGRVPVDPETTLFRIGSVTKLFTWTAVMQLVEQGRLDLDADVAGYLDFEIPATFEEPITLRHLMTHTAGFEEDMRDSFSTDPAGVRPLGGWLATHVPARVRPPGRLASYSNWGAALAGYIVERVSGEDWHDYVRRRILEPLGMRHATTRQPLPAEHAAAMSHGYAVEAGEHVPQPFEIVVGAEPAASISASAGAMAKFLLAHLGRPAADGRPILAPETLRRMHATSFVHDERVPGMALGFYEQSAGEPRVVGHGGGSDWFHSAFSLIPSEDLGIFVAYNTQTAVSLGMGGFLDAFLEHYWPAPPPPAEPPAWAAEQTARVAGEYAFSRRAHTTYQKAFLLAGAMRFSALDDGALRFDSPIATLRLVPVGPLLYRDADGRGLVAFGETRDGEVAHAFLGLTPMMALERLPRHEAPSLHRPLIGLAALVFLATVGGAVRGLWRRRRRSPLARDPLPGTTALVAAAAANLAFLVALGALLADPLALLTSPLTGLKAALALPVAGTLFALVAAGFVVKQWRERAGSAGRRLVYAATVAVALLFAWSLSTFNLLGWKL